jgi:hypothetical protein
LRELFSSLLRGTVRHRRALLTLTVTVVLVLILVNGAFLVVSRYPRVCLMCHYMDPYYAQWQNSSHRDVTCVKCHPLNPAFITINTLKYLTDSYNPRPIADVPDKSCLSEGCHEGRVTHGEVLYNGAVRFDHADHLGASKRGIHLRCTSCHGQIVQGAHIAVTEKVCFLCHFMGVAEGTSLTGCTSCHGTPTQTVEHEGFTFSHESYLKAGVECAQCHLKVADGNGEVPAERCFQCHVERIGSYSDPELVHNVHVDSQGIDCFKCHEQITHGEIRMISALEVKCENCHENLHMPQKEMYMGTGARGVPDVPSRMFAAQVTCDGCHTHRVPAGASEFGEESLEAERASCVACHGKGYDLMLDDWIRVVDGAVEKVGDDLEETSAAVRSQGESPELKALLDDATYDYDFVKEGHGVHNVEYAVRLLKRTEDILDETRSKLRPSLKALPRDRLLGTPDGYCSMLCHERIGVPESVTFERMDFPHGLHSREIGLECTMCHSPDKHKMRVITKSGCMECHHGEVELDCGTCHFRQSELYSGRLTEIDREGDPDFMAQADISCADCHDPNDARAPLDQARDACVACHDESYGESLAEWINDGQRAAAELLLLEKDLGTAIENGSVPEDLRAEARSSLDESARVREFLELARPAHNYMLSQELLEEKQNTLKRLLESTEGESANR